MTIDRWKIKLLARVHDSAEKALILMHGGKEDGEGSVKRLRERIGPTPENAERIVKRADRWAAAADRPRWGEPADQAFRFADQVRFRSQPELTHPLSGTRVVIGKPAEDGASSETAFQEIEPEKIEDASFESFDSLIHEDETGALDPYRTLLAFWRFGPEPARAPEGLELLWNQLPADTRVPDHSIWTHLDLTSAFAGAMAEDDRPALLIFTFGPVQDFIAQARSTTDLWAGSHLLATLAWEGMRPLIETIGPDAVLFPQLRGVPQVDAWLLQECGLEQSLFSNLSIRQEYTDQNPLFSAGLPNRFAALVPASRAEELAAGCGKALRDALSGFAADSLHRLLEEAGLTDQDAGHAREQLRAQLEGMPEIHHVVVPWELAGGTDKLSADPLAQALKIFHGTEKAGVFGHPFWNQVVEEGENRYFPPNPGFAYPALYDLAERALAAVKTARPFGQRKQEGYRCTTCGEREWLTTEAVLLETHGAAGFWEKVGESRRSLAKKGEKLCAVCATKRTWPLLVMDRYDDVLMGHRNFQRFVISTHSMALSSTLERWASGFSSDPALFEARAKKVSDGYALLPGRTASRIRSEAPRAAHLAHYIPGVFDALADEDRAAEAKSLLQDLGLEDRETYYALVLMDGDRMGSWIDGTSKEFSTTYRDVFRSGIEQLIENSDLTELGDFFDSRRLPGPARHATISAALNHFSLRLARAIVEDVYGGKILYCGGDDLMAMLPVPDLLTCLEALRCAFSGITPDEGIAAELASSGIRLAKGYAMVDGSLAMTMGERASVSAGAVIAHHRSPLARVLTELRAAEKAAKSNGRASFSIRTLKRSGGAVHTTARWCVPEQDGKKTALIPLLRRTSSLFAGELSRRAAYFSTERMRDLPQEPQLLAADLAYQFGRQTSKEFARKARPVARELARLAALQPTAEEQSMTATLTSLLKLAEFISRREGKENNHD